jgi:hypothetical protein
VAVAGANVAFMPFVFVSGLLHYAAGFPWIATALLGGRRARSGARRFGRPVFLRAAGAQPSGGPGCAGGPQTGFRMGRLFGELP